MELTGCCYGFFFVTILTFFVVGGLTGCAVVVAAVVGADVAVEVVVGAIAAGERNERFVKMP